MSPKKPSIIKMPRDGDIFSAKKIKKTPNVIFLAKNKIFFPPLSLRCFGCILSSYVKKEFPTSGNLSELCC